MTINISLSKELEGLVHSHVDNGAYQNASELVQEALCNFFNDDEELSQLETNYIRNTIAPRMAAVQNGTAILLDGDAVFAEMDELLKD